MAEREVKTGKIVKHVVLQVIDRAILCLKLEEKVEVKEDAMGVPEILQLQILKPEDIPS